jgi:hypothetical protein
MTFILGDFLLKVCLGLYICYAILALFPAGHWKEGRKEGRKERREERRKEGV